MVNQCLSCSPPSPVPCESASTPIDIHPTVSFPCVETFHFGFQSLYVMTSLIIRLVFFEDSWSYHSPTVDRPIPLIPTPMHPVGPPQCGLWSYMQVNVLEKTSDTYFDNRL